MRVLSLVFCFMFLINVTGKAQPNKIGVQGGVNQVFYTNDIGDFTSEKSIVGFGGFRAEYNLAGNFDFDTGLIFERQGGYNEFEERTPQQPGGTGRIFNTRLYFDYLTLPLLVKYQLWDKVPVYAKAGPVINFLLNEKYDTNRISDFHSRGVNLGAAGGLGAGIPINKRFTLNLELGYKISVTRPVASSGLTLYAYALSAGVMYNL